MPTFGSTRRATRPGGDGRTGIVVEGVDVAVASFIREAVTIGPKAGDVVVALADRAAQRMRNRVHIDEGELLDSITSDQMPSRDGLGVYADAGPDPAADSGAFKAHFWEHGTVKMAPDPFAGPSGDETAPELFEAIKRLPSL